MMAKLISVNRENKKLTGKIGLISAIAVLFLTFSACRKEVANLNQPTVNTNQPSANSNVKLFNGKGIVTKINLELVSVELDHEAIEGSMPAMIMEFYVKEKRELETLKIGDKVEFVLEENRGQEKIISIKKIK